MREQKTTQYGLLRFSRRFWDIGSDFGLWFFSGSLEEWNWREIQNWRENSKLTRYFKIGGKFKLAGKFKIVNSKCGNSTSSAIFCGKFKILFGIFSHSLCGPINITLDHVIQFLNDFAFATLNNFGGKFQIFYMEIRIFLIFQTY